jgi:hypothetical protein
MSLYHLGLSFFILVNGTVWLLAVHQSRKGNFYGNTVWLWPLSIFVWGDALVLALYWIVAAVALAFFSPIRFGQVYFLTQSIRSAYEVVYWFLNQFIPKDTQPPLFKKIAWIKPNDAAILYQVLQMCLAIGAGCIVWWLGTLAA